MCIICMAFVLQFKLLFNLYLVSIFVYRFKFNKTFMIILETKFRYAIIKSIEIPLMRKKEIASSGNVDTFFSTFFNLYLTVTGSIVLKVSIHSV